MHAAELLTLILDSLGLVLAIGFGIYCWVVQVHALRRRERVDAARATAKAVVAESEKRMQAILISHGQVVIRELAGRLSDSPRTPRP